MEADLNEKKIEEIREDFPTQPFDIKIESTGAAQEDGIFSETDEVELPSERLLWQRKQEKRITVHTEPPVITVSHWLIIDNCANLIRHSLDFFNKFPRILVEEDADPVLLNFK